MYLLKEGSCNTKDPYFVKLPDPSTNPADNHYLFFPEHGTGKWFFEAGMAEKRLIQWCLENFIKGDQEFLDIGAHVGTYSIVCGKHAKRTHAFECSPTTFCYLAANIALHKLTDRVSVYNCALGDKEGSIDYYVRSEDGGGNGVKKVKASDADCEKVPIHMRTLDSYTLTNIGFIKLDVEGFETEVLKGGVETLARCGYPPILFESWGEWRAPEGIHVGQLREELFDFITSLGYAITPVTGVSDTFLATCVKK
jgi:FkbM family methyltransferase